MRRLLWVLACSLGCGGAGGSGHVATPPASRDAGGDVVIGVRGGGGPAVGIDESDAQGDQTADLALGGAVDVLPSTDAAAAALPAYVAPWPSSGGPIPDPTAKDSCYKIVEAMCQREVGCSPGPPDRLAQCESRQTVALDDCKAIWATGDVRRCLAALQIPECKAIWVNGMLVLPEACVGVLIHRP